MTEYPEGLKMLLLGACAGVLSGMFGIGGGLVIVPALVVIFGFPIKTAVGTSLLAILLPTGLLGAWKYWQNGDMKVSAGLWVALGLFFGAYVGAHVAGSLSQIAMKRVYAIFLLVVAIYFLVAPARTDRRRELSDAPLAPAEIIGGGPEVTPSTDRPLH